MTARPPGPGPRRRGPGSYLLGAVCFAVPYALLTALTPLRDPDGGLGRTTALSALFGVTVMVVVAAEDAWRRRRHRRRESAAG